MQQNADFNWLLNPGKDLWKCISFAKHFEKKKPSHHSKSASTSGCLTDVFSSFLLDPPTDVIKN